MGAVKYLTGDEVLANGESHLDGVRLVRYGDGGQLEFVPAVHLVGLVHCIFEDLLVPLLAQDGPDVYDLRLAAGPSAGARQEHRQQKQTHRADHQTGQRSPLAFLPGGGSARPASGRQHGLVTAEMEQGGRRVRGSTPPKKELTRGGKDLGGFMCNAVKSASLGGR